MLLCLFALLGCSLFPGTDSNSSSGTQRSLLPPLKASPEAIQLDIFFLERPSDDPLLTTGIWKEVVEVGTLSPETRENLQDNGFRIAHFSSNPPPSVQKLLGMVAEIPSEVPEYAKPIMGRHTFLPPGGETEISTGIELDQCEFQLRCQDGTKTFAYEKVSCVLRMKAHRLQAGWVRVEFQPEIHHGDRQMRPHATADGWSYRGGQNIDTLSAQRFDLTMNVGETLLITSTPDDDGSLGDRFFCHEVGGTNNQRVLKKQRILLIRVVDSGKSQSSFAR